MRVLHTWNLSKSDYWKYFYVTAYQWYTIGPPGLKSVNAQTKSANICSAVRRHGTLCWHVKDIIPGVVLVVVLVVIYGRLEGRRDPDDVVIDDQMPASV